MQLILQRLQGVKKILAMVGVGFQDDGLRVFEAAHAEDGLAVHDVAPLSQLYGEGKTVGDVDQRADAVCAAQGDVYRSQSLTSFENGAKNAKKQLS